MAKGLGMAAIIIGMVAMTVLPVLLGTFLCGSCRISEEPDQHGMMILMMWVVTKIMPSQPGEEKPKQVTEKAS